jgi:hypothetical protein
MMLTDADRQVRQDRVHHWRRGETAIRGENEIIARFVRSPPIRETFEFPLVHER